MGQRATTPDTTSEKVKASAGDASAGYLDGKVDSIGIEVSANKLQVKDNGITGAKQLTAVPKNIQVFTSSGTWTKPAGISKVYVKVWGGGGGGSFLSGGNSGRGGGGGGGYSEGLVAVTGNVTVTVGAGGADGSSVGVAGGTSSFVGETTLQAVGGSGGNSTIGGVGGAGSGGTINLTGGVGGDYATDKTGGDGGGAAMGGAGGAGGKGITSGTGTAKSGTSPGGGGGGSGDGSGGNTFGGDGADGLVIVMY